MMDYNTPHRDLTDPRRLSKLGRVLLYTLLFFVFFWLVCFVFWADDGSEGRTQAGVMTP